MDTIIATLIETLNSIILYIPNFISGLVILIIGLIIASVAKTLVQKGARFINVRQWLSKANIEEKNMTRVWVNILSQIVYWFILISFLIPAFNAWKLPAITNILGSFILYLPNVFAAVIIGFAGVIASGIAYQAVRSASFSLGRKVQVILSSATRYSIIFFAVLIALNQLGISPNLIQILLTGFVAALAIAIGLGLGLSIGLGGREAVKDALDNFINSSGIIGAKGGKAKTADKNDKSQNKESKDSKLSF